MPSSTALRKLPGSVDAWAAYQRGLWYLSKYTVDDTLLAEKYFRQAIDLDPTFSGGYGRLAAVQARAVDFQTRDLPDTLSLAEGLARRAVALDGADAEARSHLAEALYRRGDYEGGLAEAERALAISPNLAAAHWRCWAKRCFSPGGRRMGSRLSGHASGSTRVSRIWGLF